MEKTTFKLKSFQAFNEDISAVAYPADKTESTEKKDEKPAAPAESVEKIDKTIDEKPAEKAVPEAEKTAEVKAEEEEAGASLNKALEKCIENVEEIVRLFEKDDTKLIDMSLPILDLCQTNLNFQEKKSHGATDILTASKKVIKELAANLKKEYPNNDPVTELISNCNKI